MCMFIVMNEELPEKVTNYKRTYGKVKNQKQDVNQVLQTKWI